jgi:catechol 2,3-dioxygenase-like lactoylglutathione lyase family enzyme
MILEGGRASLTVHVSELDAAVRWYGDVFGNPAMHRGTDVSLTGDTTSFAVFNLAGMKVFLSETGVQSVDCQVDHHPSTLVFMTRRRLSELRPELALRGAIFRDDEVVDGFPVDEDGVRTGRNAEFLWFYDPDGNKMEFCRVLGRN